MDASFLSLLASSDPASGGRTAASDAANVKAGGHSDRTGRAWERQPAAAPPRNAHRLTPLERIGARIAAEHEQGHERQRRCRVPESLGGAEQRHPQHEGRGDQGEDRVAALVRSHLTGTSIRFV
jgi:hypothetical protein